MAHTTKPAITSFRGMYRFLSNFYPASVVYEGLEFRTVEHAYVAAKSTDLLVRRNIQTLVTPGGAKMAGRRIALRPDWEEIKLGVMKGLLAQKFKSFEFLGEALVFTGDAPLIEGNTWGDRFWGAVQAPDGEWIGENHLGRLLMERRAELQS